MRNILRIFVGDLMKVKYNVIAWIMIMGLTVVPSLYAWFNIAASWDPYSNTGNLKVAVVNADRGYSGDLVPLHMNIGETVTAELRKNDRMDWVFVDKKTALDGVRSGTYYAAIVIPKRFSDDMMSFFTPHVKHSSILYYVNQKENAIAPKVTDSGASAVQREISRNFLSTILQVELDVMNGLERTVSRSGTKSMMQQLRKNLQKTEVGLDAAAGSVEAVGSLTGSLSDLLDVTAGFLKDSGKQVQKSRKAVRKAGSRGAGLASSLDTAVSGIGDMLTQMDQSYAAMDEEIGRTLEEADTDLAAGENDLQAMSRDVGQITARYEAFLSDLKAVDRALPDRATASHRVIARMEGRIEASIAEQNALRQDLQDAASASAEARRSTAAWRTRLRGDVDSVRSTIGSMKAEYEKSWRREMKTLLRSMDRSLNAADSTLGAFGKLAGTAAGLSSGTAGDLRSLHRLLASAGKELRSADAELKNLIREVRSVSASGSWKALSRIMDNDPRTIADFLSAPVDLQRISVYPVKNYGSAMAPFYTTLALWVGAVILVAIMKADMTEDRRIQFARLRPYQAYFGRLILFAIIAFLQATLVALGDLLFLEIQCIHPLLFLIACWITSLVYVIITYSLVLSFGDVGKAVCVILMVLQVAGSGGTFPVEMMPKAFRMTYPFLPFVHSMNAMRECVAGRHANDYWIYLGKLGLFVIPMLVIGLILRKPIIRLNRWMEHKLESTKVM